ncbi:hypothetical protein DFP72DRAFT_854103 [Ephemerocybe angulata]|uniref:Uncharacterized protein n=1 Tax=Ephemerocybe angulata TaxID=980116 RepID=A0A8H6LZG3_9AGAR|nr:hypothetical protein DFP72DRAFT_854103 [Tulosesus angulatus]
MPRLSPVLTLATSCPYSLPILVSLTPEWYNKGKVSEETREGLCNEPAVHDARWLHRNLHYTSSGGSKTKISAGEGPLISDKTVYVTNNALVYLIQRGGYPDFGSPDPFSVPTGIGQAMNTQESLTRTRVVSLSSSGGFNAVVDWFIGAVWTSIVAVNDADEGDSERIKRCGELAI